MADGVVPVNPNLPAQAVLFLDPQKLSQAGVPIERFHAIIDGASRAGIPSACIRSTAPLSLTVNYMSNPGFNHAMYGQAPAAARDGSLFGLSGEAMAQKQAIDAGLAAALAAQGVTRIVIGTENSYSGGLHEQAIRSRSAGLGCP